MASRGIWAHSRAIMRLRKRYLKTAELDGTTLDQLLLTCQAPFSRGKSAHRGFNWNKPHSVRAACTDKNRWKDVGGIDLYTCTTAAAQAKHPGQRYKI